ncbi:hypothetical protein TG4357_03798 [Thalassovita gelatinovora]|uniref:Uncharacterized protein n=2 Tax=Thalassovita gelatinovora TaxID=53501 RepID=A0A0P1FKU7_THAGE|nr:hypothetical protein TG4357_03798 [Thalassovita gelatinovora]SEQ58603.1 protein of unknown function [Thalassovita gelatinovora]
MRGYIDNQGRSIAAALFFCPHPFHSLAMRKPVNLNQFRKQKARADKRTRADENAVKFGRSKAEKSLDTVRVEKAARDLDGKKRE